MTLDVDVAVIGAGPAGAVAAMVLAGLGRRVALIDPLASPEAAIRRKIGESLPGAARPLIRGLGLLDAVESGPHQPSYGNASAWGSASLVATDFLRDPNGLGWHLDRARFDADLRAAAAQAGVATVSAHVRSTALRGAEWVVRLAAGELAAGFVIDATGRGAVVARRHGATRSRDDALAAVYAWVQPPPGDVDSRTLIEAVPEGWWYTARLPSGERVVALHVDEPSPSAWSAALARTTHVRAVTSGATPCSEPRVAEACGARLDRFFGEGWLATGDAALSFDPLSSQGVFNALYTGMRAGQSVDAALAGDSEALAAYAARLEQIRAHYLGHRSLYYATERRWLDCPFWARRSPVGRPERALAAEVCR